MEYSMKTALYRHFDADGVLLYIGISLDAIHRLGQHKNNAHWYSAIVKVTVEWHPSREVALEAERAAIAAEGPLHNIQRPAIVGSVQVALPARSKLSQAVMHQGSFRLNGWYPREHDAEHMLGWFRAVFPKDRFVLVEHHPFGSDRISEVNVLKPAQHELWAATPPDYEAGDRFDSEAA